MAHDQLPVSAQQFIDHILTSGLMDQVELDRAFQQFPPTNDAMALAKLLIKNNYLTRYQAKRLLKGKTDGFLMGQYRIMEEIGRGGMGRVYKALHQAMGRSVALKVLAPELTKTERARQLFQREVRAAAKLTHPHIVTAYDANHAGDRFFLVMEFVDGQNLSRTVKDHGPLSVGQACEFIRQTALGLGYAHNLGLIHRDIKPANLLMHHTPKGPQIKILDFGLAHMMANDDPRIKEDNAPPQTMLGTADYVSPEQARNHRMVDGRSDLYSLGCTFYFLLTGHGPFPGGTALEKIVRHTADTPTDIQTLRPDVPDAVADIIRCLLAKKPSDRYRSAEELIVDLEAVLEQDLPWEPPSQPAVDEAAASDAVEADESSSQSISAMSDTTLPSAMQPTDDTTAPSGHFKSLRSLRPTPVKTGPSWPWLIVIAIAALGVLVTIGLIVRFVSDKVAGQ